MKLHFNSAVPFYHGFLHEFAPLAKTIPEPNGERFAGDDLIDVAMVSPKFYFPQVDGDEVALCLVLSRGEPQDDDWRLVVLSIGEGTDGKDGQKVQLNLYQGVAQQDDRQVFEGVVQFIKNPRVAERAGQIVAQAVYQFLRDDTQPQLGELHLKIEEGA